MLLGETSRAPERVAAPRLSPALRATLCVMMLLTGTVSMSPMTPYVHTLPLALLLLVVLWLLGQRSETKADRLAERVGLVSLGILLTVGAVDLTVSLLNRVLPDQPDWLRYAVVAVYVVSVCMALGPSLWFRGFMAIQLAAYVAIIRSGRPVDDVLVSLHGSIHGLLHGQDPYALTFPNVYDAVHTAMYYAPGMVVDGRITYGFAYLPTVLFGYLPGYLLGDLRYSSALALVGTALIAHHLSHDRLGRLMSLCLVVSPLPLYVIYINPWTEPVIGLVLAMATWSLWAGRARLSAVSLGLLYATKQYLVVALPLLVVLGRLHGRRAVWLTVLVTALVVLPFVIVDPGAFFHSTVQYQLRQRFRPDSISLSVDLATSFGRPPDWVFGLLPLAAGFTASWWTARVLPPTATALALGTGLSLLAVILLSKQAYSNYFLLVMVAVGLAAIVDNRAAADPVSDSG